MHSFYFYNSFLTTDKSSLQTLSTSRYPLSYHNLTKPKISLYQVLSYNYKRQDYTCLIKWIFPIQIGLLVGKIVQIMGICKGIIFPGIVIYIKQIISGERFGFFCIPPTVIIPVWICPGRAALLKPFNSP